MAATAGIFRRSIPVRSRSSRLVAAVSLRACAPSARAMAPKSRLVMGDMLYSYHECGLGGGKTPGGQAEACPTLLVGVDVFDEAGYEGAVQDVFCQRHG